MLSWFFFGGVSVVKKRIATGFRIGTIGLSTNMRPYNVTLDKRGPMARAECRRCEVCLGGSGGMLPRNIFEFRVSEMPFPGLWGKI